MLRLKTNQFTVFEHDALRIGEKYNDVEFKQQHLELLEQFFKEKNFPYYTIIKKGVRFCEYVGVIQAGNMTIEILPKIDKNSNAKEDLWRKMLIDMLRSIGVLDIHAPSSSALKLKNNSLLDLYFELFINECQLLLHKGLIKKYRKQEGNSNALKGSLLFNKQIQQNITHQERFFVRSTAYDKYHNLNCILYKTLKLLNRINSNHFLNSKIGSMLLNFPELPDIKVSDGVFNKIQLNRKTDSYKKALQIAKLLLLNYHPDVQSGKNDILALMFDMNVLWEEFVLKSLKKHNTTKYQFRSQTRKIFWKQDDNSIVKMIPDIIVEENGKVLIVLDTKWKNIKDANPSSEDLRQMYVYSRFHNNAKTALIYPGEEYIFKSGNYRHEEKDEYSDNICAIMKISVNNNISEWQHEIYTHILDSKLFYENNL